MRKGFTFRPQNLSRALVKISYHCCFWHLVFKYLQVNSFWPSNILATVWNGKLQTLIEALYNMQRNTKVLRSVHRISSCLFRFLESDIFVESLVKRRYFVYEFKKAFRIWMGILRFKHFFVKNQILIYVLIVLAAFVMYKCGSISVGLIVPV